MEILHNLGIDPQLVVVQVVGFLVLLFLLNRFVYKPVFGMLEQRQSDIKSTYDQLDRDREAMEATRREYESRLAGIEAQAREQIQAAVKEAQELRASIIAEAKQQSVATIEAGRAELERERARAFVEMRRQVADIAILAAEKVIGESMDDARQRKLVDQFITTIATPAGGSAISSNGAGTA